MKKLSFKLDKKNKFLKQTIKNANVQPPNDFQDVLFKFHKKGYYNQNLLSQRIDLMELKREKSRLFSQNIVWNLFYWTWVIGGKINSFIRISFSVVTRTVMFLAFAYFVNPGNGYSLQFFVWAFNWGLEYIYPWWKQFKIFFNKDPKLEINLYWANVLIILQLSTRRILNEFKNKQNNEYFRHNINKNGCKTEIVYVSLSENRVFYFDHWSWSWCPLNDDLETEKIFQRFVDTGCFEADRLYVHNVSESFKHRLLRYMIVRNESPNTNTPIVLEDYEPTVVGDDVWLFFKQYPNLTLALLKEDVHLKNFQDSHWYKKFRFVINMHYYFWSCFSKTPRFVTSNKLNLMKMSEYSAFLDFWSRNKIISPLDYDDEFFLKFKGFKIGENLFVVIKTGIFNNKVLKLCSYIPSILLFGFLFDSNYFFW